MGRLLAGVGRAHVTPPVGIEMGCWAMRNGLAQGVHDEMLARALVLDDGATSAAIVTMDVLYLTSSRANHIRQLIADQVPVPAGNILLNCSHTHTTPYTGSFETAHLSAGHQAYLAAFDYAVASAAVQAWHSRQEAAIGAASTMVEGVVINRRNPALPVDPELGVVRVDDAAGRPLACLASYACHATCVGAHYLLWTADFPGYLARTIEAAQPGCAGMFLQGAEGDIQPWDWYFDNPRPRWGDTYEAAERLGQALAGPALGLLNQISTDSQAEIRVASNTIVLPPRPIRWTVEEAEAHLAEVAAWARPYTGATIPDRVPGCMSAQSFPGPYELSDAQHEVAYARRYPQPLPAELTALRVNDIALAAIPGEMFNELGVQLKERSPVAYTYIAGVTNGRVGVGYLPTRAAAEASVALPLSEFTDQVKHRKDYGTTATTEVGPEAGEMVVDELLRLIETIK
jgi:neutral ceramidase